MPVDTAHLMENVYDFFTDLYAAQSTGGAFLAFETGVPITPAMFRIDTPPPAVGPSEAPLTPKPAFSPALAIERLSEIANVVLEVNGASIHRSNRTVDAMTEMLLGQSMPVSSDTMAMLGAVKDPAAKKLDLKLGSLMGPYQFRPIYATPANWYDPDAKDNWTSHAVGNQSATTPPPSPPAGPSTTPNPSTPPARVGPRRRMMAMSEANWRVLPPDLQATASVPVTNEAVTGETMTSETVTPQRRVQAATQYRQQAGNMAMRVSAFEDNAGPATAQVMNLQAKPQMMRQRAKMSTQLATPAVTQMASQAVSQQQLALAINAASSTTSEMAQPVHLAAYSRPLVMAVATAQINATTVPQPVAANSLDISFEHCIVTLTWPWLPQGFFLTRNWYVPGYRQASFSNGTGVGDTGMLPIVPSGFVAIRNLNIVAKWSNDDVVAMQRSAAFGPFSLQGHKFDSGSGTLSCPGMQIIGWFCEALPVLPPASDPSLVPADPPAAAPTATGPSTAGVTGTAAGSADIAGTAAGPATPAATASASDPSATTASTTAGATTQTP
jgi:hypothetical protein